MATKQIEEVLRWARNNAPERMEATVADALGALEGIVALASDAAGADRFPLNSSEHARRTHSAMRLVRMLTGKEP